MVQHIFTLQADWPGGRNDTGTIRTKNLNTAVSIPPEMDGPGIGTNPDELLLGAAATCYIITLAAIMERSHLPKKSLTMTSEGLVDVTNGVITYQKIIHKPRIVLQAGATDKDIQKAHKLVEKAEASCMISRAVKGNVEIELEASIEKVLSSS